MISLALVSLVISAQTYRVTLDVVAVEVDRRRGAEIELGVDTRGIGIFRGSPDLAVRAFERAGRKTTRGQRFIVTVPNHPARISATTSIPYTRTTFHPWYFGGTTTTGIDFLEVGSDLRVTVSPCGDDLVSVDVAAAESETTDTGLPPITRRQEIATAVVLPIGSSIVIAGAPTATNALSGSIGGTIERTPRGTIVVGAGRDAREYDLMMILSVTPQQSMSRDDADRMIEEFFNKLR